MHTRNDRSTGVLIPMSAEECQALLDTRTTGRVAFVNDDGQQLIPVNFAYLGGVIYFRTKRESILGQLARGHDDVAFGIDHVDVFRHGWNVTVRGPATEVEDRATINLVLGHELLRPWAGGVRQLVIKVTPKAIDGRRVSGNAA